MVGRFLASVVVLAVLGAAAFLWPRREAHAPTLATPTPTPLFVYPVVSPSTVPASPVSSPIPASLPPRVLLDVPFMTQAPTGSWEQPWQDACEEAAILMAYRWATGRSVTRAEAKDEILAMVEFQKARFGGYHDTSAAQTVELYKEFYKRDDARLVESATPSDVKRELAAGHVVLLPMAGQRLNGPFYRPPGPLYHMLLVRGYDDTTKEFIVNDDGTNTKGEAFRFSYAAIDRAWNDWSAETDRLAAPGAARPMIIVSRR